MFKWLSGSRRKPPPKVVTDDPLATIHCKSNEVYAVTRVNPIFIEEDGFSKESDEKIEEEYNDISRAGNHSGSSGYESHRSSRSSSGGVLDDEIKPIEDTDSRTTDPSTNSVKNCSPVKDETKRKCSLSTIPEGQIDGIIPKPIWPDRKRSSVELGDEFLFYKSLRFDQTSRVHRKARRPSCLQEEVTETESSKEQLNTPDEDSNSQEETSSSSCSKDWSSESASPQQEKVIPQTPTVHIIETYNPSSSSGYSTPTPRQLTYSPVFVNEINETNLVKNSRAVLSPDKTKSRSPSSSICEIQSVHSATHSLAGKQSRGSSIYVPDGYHYDFRGYRGLDFTLDSQQIQVLVKKLKIRKKHRVWCRFVIYFVGLTIFVITVIIVNLIFTRGKRFFGSL